MRIQLDLPDQDVQELKDLMLQTRLDTYKDLFTNAFTLLHWTLDQVRSGRVIASVNEADGKYRELSMPIFQAAKAHAKAEARAAQQG